MSTADTESSRILIHEFEPGWWILANITLTRIQRAPPPTPRAVPSPAPPPIYEYSAREVSPSTLLLAQIVRAHSVFLLHHGPSLADLYDRLGRMKLNAALSRFWGAFAGRWDVLLHGNPAAHVMGGVKLAVGGELGFGVGEEEWGSGEREVLEAYVARTPGLVDCVVSRFGEGPGEDIDEAWLGGGMTPGADDGAVFTGVGALSKDSLNAIATWTEELFRYGLGAYGVQQSPHSARRKRRRRALNRQSSTKGHDGKVKGDGDHQDEPRQQEHPGIPPPIVRAASRALEVAESRAEEKAQARSELPEKSIDADSIFQYMTFGLYNPTRTSGAATPSAETQSSRGVETPKSQHDSTSNAQKARNGTDKRNVDARAERVPNTARGSFLIGLQGNLEDEDGSDEETAEDASGSTELHSRTTQLNKRILLRTLHIERASDFERARNNESIAGSETSRSTYHDRLQVLVYARQPFIFVFLFTLQTPSLAYASFYRSLHYQLGPLKRPLLRSTAPALARARLHSAVSPRTPIPLSSNAAGPPGAAPDTIYDLIYDPSAGTLHSTLPGIPEHAPDSIAASNNKAVSPSSWGRLDALGIHAQIVATVAATRGPGAAAAALERAAKTSRGWWVVWIRLPPGEAVRATGDMRCREAVLVRRASEWVEGDSKKKGRVGSLMGMVGIGSPGKGREGGMGRLVEGIGVDARRYVEGLLNVGR